MSTLVSRRDAIKLGTSLGVLAVNPQLFAFGRTIPGDGVIPVAFVLSDGAVTIDFAGPWAVFESVMIGDTMPFHLYTVAESTRPIRASGGMKIVPDYAFADAPGPKVIVIPAQNGQNFAMLDWIRRASEHTDVTMSVCSGAFVLASTGLLSGKSATTFHSSFAELEAQYPDIQVKRGVRFVDNGRTATSAGLSSGMDLAFHIVERYYGRQVADKAAYELEYQGQGWKDANSNSQYMGVSAAAATDRIHPACAVCGMDADPAVGQSSYQGQTYMFCMAGHKTIFDANPAKIVAALVK
jgi:transcriptional regulator GlxA family with amidase domain/YHS domain-containing protein